MIFNRNWDIILALQNKFNKLYLFELYLYKLYILQKSSYPSLILNGIYVKKILWKKHLGMLSDLTFKFQEQCKSILIKVNKKAALLRKF